MPGFEFSTRLLCGPRTPRFPTIGSLATNFADTRTIGSAKGRGAVESLLHTNKIERDKNFQELKAIVGETLEAKELKTRDGNLIPMWFGKQQKKDAPTKIFFHGRKSHIGKLVPRAIKAFNQGYNVCLFSYRGHSGDLAKPTEQGMINDALAVFDELIDRRGISPTNIDIEAGSLGCAVALNALAKRFLERESKPREHFNHVILRSPFASVKGMSKYHLPVLPHFFKRWLLDDLWNNTEALKVIAKNIKNLTIIHGNNDVVVPFAEGMRLFMDARKLVIPANFITAEGYGHNDLNTETIYSLIKAQMLEAKLPYIGDHAHRSIRTNTIDISMPMGTMIYAMRPGRVIEIIDSYPDKTKDESGIKTNKIRIEGDDGLIQEYSSIQNGSTGKFIKVGDQVQAGQRIGKSGANGYSSQPRLTCSISKADRAIPIKFTKLSLA